MLGKFKYCVFLVFVLFIAGPSSADDLKDDRRRAENILNQISKDVHDTYYDPNLKGLDWAALTEQARERIRNAKNTGQMYGAISALLFQLHDSHTNFFPPRRRSRAIYGFKAKPFGEKIFVYEVDPDGPAAKGGLQVGDQIVGINNLNAVRPTFGAMMRYLIFTDPREELDVEVQEGPSSHIIKIPVKLIPITREVLESDMEEHKHPYTVHDYGDGIVSLDLKTFGVAASEIKAMTKQARDAKAIVLDLRDNSGGLEDTMVELMNRLALEPYEMGKNVSREKSFTLVVKPDPSRLGCPLFVLIDSRSASASEMAARSLQLHKRAVIIGDRSSGSVEAAHIFWRPVSFGDRGIHYGTEIAFSKFVLENGEELENQGVTPDQMCIPAAADLRNGKDPCLDQALALARAAVAGQTPRVAVSR